MRKLKTYGNLTPDQSKLVEDHGWVVGKLVYRCIVTKRGYTGSFHRDDLTQIGNFALCVAARRWDPKKNVKFSTYAWTYVNGYLSHALTDKSRMVRLPRWLPKLRGKIRTLREEGKPYSEIKKILNVPDDKLYDCETSYGEIHVPLDIENSESGTAFSSHAVYNPKFSEFQNPEQILRRIQEYPTRKINSAIKFLYGDAEPTQEVISLLYNVLDVAYVVWGRGESKNL